MTKYVVGQKVRTVSVIQAVGAIIPAGQAVLVKQVTESRKDRYHIEAFDGWISAIATEEELTDRAVAIPPTKLVNQRRL